MPLMDPIIATGLVNIGSNIVQKVFRTDITSTQNTQSLSFESNLNKAGGVSTSQPNMEGLRSELKDSPELKDFLSQNSGNTITMDQLSDGSVRVLSSSGSFMTLRPDSPTCSKACQFMELSTSTGQNLSPDRSNSVILIG